MSKSKIDITHTDEMQVDERIGKRKPIHTQMFKEYNIDINDGKNAPLKPIPASWVHEIIDFNILTTLSENTQIIKTNISKDKQKRLFTVTFDSLEGCKEFEGLLQENMFNAINNFLDSKDENPRSFNRNVITTSESEGLQLRISY